MEAISSTIEPANSTDNYEEENHAPYSILFLFGVFAIGAVIRLLLKTIPLPYTVVLFILGICFGLLATHFPVLEKYTELARMSPHYILYIFLPILIFESAFAMDAHTFFRCFVQCLLLAVPGLMISAALTAVLSVNLFQSYGWDWSIALLFGSILSATDPVAVVALLREIGTSKTLSTLIEGESLLNDGSAIVAYTVLIELAVPGSNIDAGGIVIKFCQISLGGPLLGLIMGKISVFCLSRVFNDAVIEITITLSSAYLTYYLAEAVLKVSGVLSLVALGVVISAEKDSISPEVEVFVHKFWEKLCYLANTVIFVVVGVVVAGATDFIESQDWFLICATYVGSTLFRFLMIGILSPALSRLGYGMRWQDAVIMTWGGLRGAVCLALALLVSEKKSLDEHKVGHKILIHVSGIVLLTLLLNAITIKPLLRILGMSKVSNWKRRNMGLAVRHLHDIQGRSIHVQKDNQFLTDADWKYVESITTIPDLFSKKPTHFEDEDVDDETGDTASYAMLRFSSCPDCETHHVISPSQKEQEEMFNEARLRMLSAQKVSYWRQFENGLLAQENVRVLLSAADSAADKDKCFITVEELRNNWKIPWFYQWLERQLREPTASKTERINLTNETANNDIFVSVVKRISHHPGYQGVAFFIILLSQIPLGLEAAYRLNPETREENPKMCQVLQILNYVFFGLFLLEISMKTSKDGFLHFWANGWNRFEGFILFLYLGDLIIHFLTDLIDLFDEPTTEILIKTYCCLRLLRFLRMFQIIKLLREHFLLFLNSTLNSYLYAGYDIGCGFMIGEEEVSKMIEEIVDYQPIAKELQSICEQNRNQVVRELALLQEEHPTVAVAVKTRHAARHVLNNSRDELNELKEKGLLDDGVYDLIMSALETQMKRLVNAPTSILPSPPIELLKNVEWIADSDDIFNFIKCRASVVSFPKGKRIYASGDPPAGIFIISLGIIKVEGDVQKEIESDGQLPNTDSFHWFSSQGHFEDCLTAGNLLGELGVLTKRPVDTNAICETEVQAFHISQESIDKAFTTFKEHPSIEFKLWRTCALRIAKTVLKNNPQYMDWSMSRIMMHLQKAILPNLRNLSSFTLESEMQDVILIQGIAEDPNTGEMFRGVSYIPRTIYTLNFKEIDTVRPMLLVIGSLDIAGTGLGSANTGSQSQLEWAERRQRWSICPPAHSRCLLHHVRRRSMIPARTSRRPSRLSVSRGSWVEGLSDYFGNNDRKVYSHSQPIDLSDERTIVTFQPDVTIPGEVSIAVPPASLARRRSTLDLPFDHVAETSFM